jgi:predicted Fe-Mo cluster-binding NifX family protein
MQIAINFQNETIAQKVLWMLEHFKNDGVEVIKVDSSDDTRIINNFKEGLKEIKQIEEGKISSRPVQEFLNEL